MGYAQFVGRVGALAVALGVTNVVGHPSIAWADEPSSNTGTESAPSTGSPDKPSTEPDKPTQTQSADRAAVAGNGMAAAVLAAVSTATIVDTESMVRIFSFCGSR